MRAVQVAEPGGPDRLVLREVADPEPGPGQVRVRVAHAGVNFIDVYHRTGLYPRDLPFTAGVEGAGVVDAVGPDVESVALADRVAWAMGPGSYAELALVPAWKLARLPDDVGTDVGAALMLQGMTAHYLVSSTVDLGPDDVALVHAAAGGVGLLLVQLARARGATVIGTCSTQEKADRVKAAGADHVIRYTEQAFQPEVMRLTDDAGATVVYDSVGKATFDGSLDSLRPRGMLALFGQSSGKVEPFDPALLAARGSLFMTRPSLGDYVADAGEVAWRSGELFEAVRSDALDVRIHDVLPLEDAAEAHRLLEGRATSGKLLLRL